MKHLTKILILLVLLACNNNDDDNGENAQTPIDNINLVTGLVISPDAYSSGIRLGNPNILINQTIVYPNPPISNMTVLSVFGEEMEAIWIVPGNEERIYSNIEFSSAYDQNTYSETIIQNNAQLQFETNLNNQVALNLESLEDGYYRIFIKINSQLEWHNIYKGSVDITTFIESWE